MVAPTYAQQLERLSFRLHELHNTRDILLARLAGSETAIRKVQDEYNCVFNKTSVIEKIPNEILATIFEEARSSKVQASQVTRRWRDVVINTPRLWSRIDVSIDTLQKVELVALYLSRSKAVPFDMTVTEHLQVHRHQTVLGELLREHMHHCSLLRISFCSTESARTILDFFVMISAPLLETFDAQCLRSTRDSHQPTTILLGGTPKLSVVHFRSFSSYMPQLHTVTTLHLHNVAFGLRVTIQNWRDIFTSLTRLVSLVIMGGFVETQIMVARSSVTLPALRTLRMVEPSGEQFQYLYDNIDAPLLECMSLHGCNGVDFAFLENSWHLGATKFPALETLVLSDFNDVDDEYLASFVRAFPHAQTVTFQGQKKNNFSEVLRLLLRTDPPGSYWPRLRHLSSPELHHFVRYYDARALLEKCLGHRIDMGQPINTLSLPKNVIAHLLMDRDGLPSQTAWMDLVTVVECESENQI
ncbi:hypothetical protein HWV62_13819 [Athelia sp. TMB]|nr:hypothetical protein HWV62_13819 [Athelia sp. TMB]